MVHITSLHHLRENNITTFLGTFWITYRIEERWVLAKTYQSSSFTHRQILRFLIKIGISCRLDTDSIVQEIKIVEIESNNLLFGIITFQLDGNDPLYWFLEHSLSSTLRSTTIQLFSQLLSNGRTTSSISLPQNTTLNDSTTQRSEVNTRVLIKSFIFSSHQSLNQIR